MPDLIRLEYRDVTMRFAQSAGPLTAVSGVSIAVRDAEVVSLIGPSGCGDATLLNLGSGLTALVGGGGAGLGGGRPNPHGAATRARANAAARRQDRAADHARSVGSRDIVRPRAGDEPPPRPHHRRDRDRHPGPRRTAEAAA